MFKSSETSVAAVCYTNYFTWGSYFRSARGVHAHIVNSAIVHKSSTEYTRTGKCFLKLVIELPSLSEMKSVSAFYQKWGLTGLFSTVDANYAFYFLILAACRHCRSPH